MDSVKLSFRKTGKSGSRYTFRADKDVQGLLVRALRDYPDISKTINAALREALSGYAKKSAN